MITYNLNFRKTILFRPAKVKTFHDLDIEIYADLLRVLKISSTTKPDDI
jgi:hypothetical protein